MIDRRISIRLLSFLLILVFSGCSEQTEPEPPPVVKAFTGVDLFDGTGSDLIEDAVLLVRDGRVEAVGPSAEMDLPTDAEIIDLDGHYIIPGMISSHVHVSDVNGLQPRSYTRENALRQLGVFARYGITTVLSLGGEEAPAFTLRNEQDVPTLDRARIYVSGPVITASTPDEARDRVGETAALGPDFIKIRVDDNLGSSEKMKPEVYRAVIEEAHRHELPVAAHIFYLDDAKDLVRAGADFIVHSVRDQAIDQEFIELMTTNDIPYCPTLTREVSTFVYESTPEFFSDPFFLNEADPDVVAQLQEPERQEAMRRSSSAQAYKAALEVALRNVKLASDAGIRIALGTDAGPNPSRFQGYFEHLEMKMMADAGMTPVQILRSATGEAARAVGVEDVGTLTEGAWADFVVLERDPTEDILNTRSIASVWVAGNQVSSLR